jgi:hypothetical protein
LVKGKEILIQNKNNKMTCISKWIAKDGVGWLKIIPHVYISGFYTLRLART